MNKEKLLIIDDEAGIRSSLKGILEDEGYTVKAAEAGEKGLSILNAEPFDLVLLDIWLPEMNGIDVLQEIQKHILPIQVIMISGHGSVESAVKATKLGAFDYLEKPLSLEKVVLTVKNALKQSRLEEENILLRESLTLRHDLIGEHPVISKIRNALNTAAPSDGRVLISGENGTGKELVARLIHSLSPRKTKRFIQINCGAIPENLLDNELFGYGGMTPTGSSVHKKGKLLIAEGGVLFLDEIDEMNMATQAKLVKVLDEGKFELMESGRPAVFDTRLISATDRDLKKLVEKGKFREDLFFKLNVIPIHMPPLRERKEDIPLLINYYLHHFSIADGKKQKTMSKEAMEAFINYSWPGNVSELINVIERFEIMVKEDEIKESHLSLLVEPIESQYVSGIKQRQTLIKARELFEKEYIHKALLRYNWKMPEAAAELEIDEKTLREKIKSLGISFLG